MLLPKCCAVVDGKMVPKVGRTCGCQESLHLVLVCSSHGCIFTVALEHASTSTDGFFAVDLVITLVSFELVKAGKSQLPYMLFCSSLMQYKRTIQTHSFTYLIKRFLC